MAFALNVLTFRGDKISDVVAFAVKEIDRRREATTAGHDEPADPAERNDVRALRPTEHALVARHSRP